MPTKRVSSAPGHVVTVTRLGRKLPRYLLNTLIAITCQEAGF